MTKTIGAVLLAVALLIFTLAAVASPPTSIVITDDFVYSDPCTGEDVHVTGTTVIRTSTSVSNDIEHVSLHVSQKDTGIGLTSGATYKINGEDTQQVNIRLVNGTGEENAVTTFNVIGKGNVANEHVKELLHVTVNAGGTVTVQRTSITDTCH
ncbi:MAG TPA: hypothetical protein VGH38_25870 [Bryobacteraceae bacterium]